jgi:5'-phosphate synthase pdxT subunit
LPRSIRYSTDRFFFGFAIDPSKISSCSGARLKIGILAVQGDFAAHAKMLADLGADTVEVRTPADLEGCDGLILPGGESTTQLQFLQEEGLDKAIGKFVATQRPVFGTCAGAILLASDVKNPKQDSLGLLDMTVLRNGYGRQVHSDVVTGKTTLHDEPLEMVFIRAPIFERIGKGIEVLAEYADKPALVQKGNVMAAAFHPELTSDTTVHRRFIELAKAAIQSNVHAPRPPAKKEKSKPAKPKRKR